MKSYLQKFSQVAASGRAAEAVRFVVNGLAATAVHFAVLTVGVEMLHIPLAAIANLIAAIVGISVSFLGNRYFVFRNHTSSIITQARGFLGLYAAIAVLHASLLFAMTDQIGIDFRISFLVATVLQVALSYFGNRKFVFSK